jgi:hypothetical protein
VSPLPTQVMLALSLMSVLLLYFSVANSNAALMLRVTVMMGRNNVYGVRE